MKLLFEESDRNEVDRVRVLLESKGIPVFVGNEDTARNFNFLALAQKYGVWVCEDDQYDCAVALLSNEQHQVKNPLDINSYYTTASQSDMANVHSYMWKKIIPAMIAILVGVIGLFAIIIYLNS